MSCRYAVGNDRCQYESYTQSFLFDFAERIVTEEALGADDAIDVLALSFASLDTVGRLRSEQPRAPRHRPDARFDTKLIR